jgi:uncharacterized GH25 family protein
MKSKHEICIVIAFFLIMCAVSDTPAYAADVRGQVVLEDENTPVAEADVSATLDGTAYIVTAQTDQNGNFTLTLDVGTWDIHVNPPTYYGPYKQSESAEVEIKSADEVVQLPVAIGLRPIKTIVTSVVIPPANPSSPAFPAENVLVTAYTPDRETFVYAYTDGQGVCFLSDVFEGEWSLFADASSVEAYKKYGQSERVTVIVGMETTTEIPSLQLRECYKRIYGVAKYKDSPISGIEIHANGWAEEDSTRTFFTDENGEFEIWVRSGKWEIKVPQVQGAEWISQDPVTAEFKNDNTSEEKEVRIMLDSLENGGILKGRVTDSEKMPVTWDGDINEHIRINAVSPENGFSRSVNPDGTGSFRFPVPAGLYEISIWLDPNQYSDYGAPRPKRVRLDSGEAIEDAGDIVLTERKLSIRGTVKDDQGIMPHIRVEAWIPGEEHFFDETDMMGKYTLNLPPGKWHVKPSVSGIFSEQFREVELKQESLENIDFVLEDTGNVITGTVQDQSGNVLTDVKAVVYARQGDSPRPVSQVRVENGAFSLNVPAGTFYVGLRLDPRSSYVFAGDKEQEISVQKKAWDSPSSPAQAAILEMSPFEQTADLTKIKTDTERDKRDDALIFTLKSDSASVTGQFLDESETPVTDISGKVFVTPVNVRAAWYDAEISAEGTFELAVPPGTWSLGYHLETDQYLPHPEHPIQIQVPSAGITQNITLPELNNTVKGQVVDPDGNPAAYVQVWVQQFRKSETGQNIFANSVFTDSDGKFEINVPTRTAGTKDAPKDYYDYVECIYTALDVCADDDYCLLDAERECEQELFKKSSSKQDSEIILRLRKADIYVEGKVFKADGQTPAENAYVSAFSADGQNISAYTDSAGAYRLNAVKADTSWTVRARYKETNADTYYCSEFVTTDTVLTDETVAMPDLILKEAGELPASETDAFMTEVGWMFTMADGTEVEIPADSVRTEEHKLTIMITPQLEVPDSLANRMLSYAYTMSLYEAESGAEVLDEFSEEVMITIYYAEDQLNLLGITVSDIRPAYFMTESNSWQTMGSYILDEENKKISFQTDHFSDWALVSVASETSEAIAGDIDNSETVDLTDLILALRLCTELPVSSAIYTAADVNEDKKIGLEEAIYILRKIAEPGA